MEKCYIDSCENIPQFYCNCKENLYICIDHITCHDDVGFHSMQALYVKLSPNVKENIISSISTTIKNLDSAMVYSHQKSEILIKQINDSLDCTLNSLKKEKEFYQDLISKCNNPRGLRKSDYHKIWRVLNDLGAKDLFKIVDFSGNNFINPTLLYIHQSILDLSQKTDSHFTHFYTEKARQDYSFKEIIEFLSKLSVKKIEIASKTSHNIIQDLKKSKSNLRLKVKKFKNFQNPEENINGLKVFFDNPIVPEVNSSVSSIFSNFSTQELIKNILKTTSNLKSLKGLLPNELKDFSVSGNILEICSSIDKVCSLTNKELISILMKKYEFNEHCDLIKSFFLFGQGDFFHLVFEDLIINKREYDLEALIQECIWKSNANSISEKFLSKILFKNDAEFYQIEWESLDIELKIEYPLSLFFSNALVSKFQKIFKFLYQFKKIEFIIKNNHHSKKVLEKSASPELENIIHKINIFHYKIVIFINTILFYMFEDIIQTNWNSFQKKIKNSLNLEDIEFALHEFVETILEKCFMNDGNLMENCYNIINILKRFTDIQHEIETSLVLYEDTNDNDYNDSIEMIDEILNEFFQSVKNFRSNLLESQKKYFFHLQHKLTEIR